MKMKFGQTDALPVIWRSRGQNCYSYFRNSRHQGASHGSEATVAQPFIVSIPHKLGKDEATRRLKAGLGSIRSEYGKILQVHEEIWSGDRLAFQLTALKQRVSGTINVAEDNVKLEVMLPWLLAGLAHGVQATIRARATRMLEKK
jgi:hypothetical protein